MKNHKVRMILACIIGMFPVNIFRTFLYSTIFGYRIYKSYIGWRTIIVVDVAELIECKIGRNNRFIGPMSITINKRATIGNGNTFSCGWWSKEEQFKAANYDRRLQIGANTLITSEHYFDVVGAFILGDNSWIAGYGSQFWTHGAGARERNIRIGEHCYIGSAVRFAPGASVQNNSIVGLGSVVTKEFNMENVIIAGQPAKIVRENYDWETQQDIG